MPGQVLNTEEVCEKYRISRSALIRMRDAGQLIFGMAGRNYRYDSAECDKVFLGIGGETKHDLP